MLRTTARLLLASYAVLLAWLVLRPTTVNWTYPANLTPLASVDRALALGGYEGARQLAAGILPLTPFGVLLPIAIGRLRTPWLPSFLRTVGGAALLATGLEILKSWTPGHVLNVDDIILGTAGAAVCHLLLVPAARALLRLRARRRHPAVLPAAHPHHRTYELASPAAPLGRLTAPGGPTAR
ncbi:VanZ family protein [Kitasatospora sp. DSM 101779]|uniref:VanZ family protein n=1 Tax=Kitasatospora sp. DSM 101779 TaxID=2853165 RepID=UPI0021DA56EB|nr:VanZ family protein [Kitasatospora sp. DSM 101779]MCU7824423.1 VanZ family protein [Kitasatospora sp. DSM 101779]